MNKHNKNSYMDDYRFITSYASSRKNSSIPKFGRKSKRNEADFLEKCQTFVNLHLLLGKGKIAKQVENARYQLASMRTRKDYADFIFKNSLLSFKSTQDTIFAHNMNLNFILKGYEKSKLDEEKQKKRIKRYFEKLDKFKNIDAEIKDVINSDFIDYLKMQKELRKIIFFENEINFYCGKKFFLFNKYENKINYIYDICLFPHFHNTLLKYNNEIDYEIKYINQLDCPNYINYKVWKNLNLKKANIQMLKDKGINNDKLIKNNTNIDNKNKKKLKIENQSNNIGVNNISFFNEENELLKNKELKNKKSRFKLQLYEELEDYFINKRIYKNNSSIASDELKKVIFNKFYKIIFLAATFISEFI